MMDISRKAVEELLGIGEYSKVSIEQVAEAERIVGLQEESVANTSDTFRAIQQFMEELTQDMTAVTQEVGKMNEGRKAALSSVRAIGEFSGNTVRSANEVSSSLEQQMASAGTLEEEAKQHKQTYWQTAVKIYCLKRTGHRGRIHLPAWRRRK